MGEIRDFLRENWWAYLIGVPILLTILYTAYMAFFYQGGIPWIESHYGTDVERIRGNWKVMFIYAMPAIVIVVLLMGKPAYDKLQSREKEKVIIKDSEKLRVWKKMQKKHNFTLDDLSLEVGSEARAEEFLEFFKEKGFVKEMIDGIYRVTDKYLLSEKEVEKE